MEGSQGIAVALLQLVIGITSAILLWLLTDRSVTDRNLILVSGLAGTTGSTLSPLMRPLAESTPVARFAGRLLYAWILAVAGFAVSAGTYILVVALLLGQLPTTTSPGTYGTITFGGLIGVASGLLLDSRLVRSGRLGTAPYPRGVSTIQPAVYDALEHVEQRLFGRPLQNYDGLVRALWYSTPETTQIAGRVRVNMLPAGLPAGMEASGLGHGLGDIVHVVEGSARVLIQGGRQDPVATFSVSVIHGSLDVLPSRAELAAPRQQPSETVEFTLLNRSAVPTVSESGGDSPRAAGEEPVEHVLIKVSQLNRTIQVLELDRPRHRA